MGEGGPKKKKNPHVDNFQCSQPLLQFFGNHSDLKFPLFDSFLKMFLLLFLFWVFWAVRKSSRELSNSAI